jgi:ABC-2 type transport system permease protein
VTGFSAFLSKELREIARTWRIWVLPGICVFFGLTSPVLALVTPAMIGSLTSGTPGMVIKIPDPVALDAYAQYMKNLTQIVTIAVIIAGGGVVSAEKRSGSAILVLVKPVSRAAFVVAKAISGSLLLMVAAAAGALLTAGGTALIFDGGDVGAFFTAVGLWLAFGLLLTCLMVLVSSVIDSQAGAAGAGLGIFALISFAGIWAPAREWTPAGLLPAAGDALAGKDVALLWPLVTAGMLAIALVAAAAWAFGRREL